MVEESCFDDLELDRYCLDFSSRMGSLFSWTYGMLGYRLVAPIEPNQFDNAASRAKEVGIRALIVLGAVLSFCFLGHVILISAIGLGLGSHLFRAIGYQFQKNGFTHVRGSAPEIDLQQGQASVIAWNIRGYKELPYDHGVVHWSSRIDRILGEIRRENPDVIVLQDVHDPALMRTLINTLGDRYAHFYIHLGPSMWGSESGCMVITKCAVHSFSYTPFIAHDPKVNRGFAMFEMKSSPNDSSPCARIIGTQLTPGLDAEEIRMLQVTQITNKLAKQTLPLPTLFVGSLHMDRDTHEELQNVLHHSYLDAEPTHSNGLVSQWAPVFNGEEETTDFISLFKRNRSDGKELPVIERGIGLVDSHLIQAFDADCNTQTALSDHSAVVTTIRGLKAVGG